MQIKRAARCFGAFAQEAVKGWRKIGSCISRISDRLAKLVLAEATFRFCFGCTLSFMSVVAEFCVKPLKFWLYVGMGWPSLCSCDVCVRYLPLLLGGDVRL